MAKKSTWSAVMIYTGFKLKVVDKGLSRCLIILQQISIIEVRWCLFGTQTADPSLIPMAYLIFLNNIENVKKAL